MFCSNQEKHLDEAAGEGVFIQNTIYIYIYTGPRKGNPGPLLIPASYTRKQGGGGIRDLSQGQ